MSTVNVNYLLTVNTTGANKAVGGLSSQMGGLQSLMAGVGPALGVAAIAAGFKEIIDVASKFEKSMSTVKALTGSVGDEFKGLQDLAKELGQTTAFSASQAADGMAFLAQAGFEADQIMSALPSTLNLAAAGSIDLARAADLASNVLSGYSFEANQLAAVSDVLTKTFTTSNTDLTGLAEAFKETAPIASSLKLQFTEVSAALGIMANSGIQGSKAGTALKNALTRLANPTKAIQGTLDDLGISVNDNEGRMRSLTDIIGQLEESGASTSEVMTIFGRIAGGPMLKLIDEGAEGIAKFDQTLQDAGGTAEDIAGVKLDNLAGSFTLLSSAYEGFILSFEDGSGVLAQGLRFIVDDLSLGFQILSGSVIQSTENFSFLGQIMIGIKNNFALVWGIVKLLIIPWKIVIGLVTQLGERFGWFEGKAFDMSDTLNTAFLVFQNIPGIIDIVVDQITKGVLRIVDVIDSFAGILQGLFTFDPAKIAENVKGVFEAVEGAVKDFGGIGGQTVELLQGKVAEQALSGTESDQLGIGSLISGGGPQGSGGAGGGAAGLAGAGNLGADVAGAKGTKLTNINITINKLVETLTISTTNLSESTARIKDEVSKALLTAVNDVNIIAG